MAQKTSIPSLFFFCVRMGVTLFSGFGQVAIKQVKKQNFVGSSNFRGRIPVLVVTKNFLISNKAVFIFIDLWGVK